jgi:hypothetical protein
MSGQGVILVDQAAVTMSPQHFKNFVRSAIEALTAYENTFGVLQTPDEITAPGASAQQMEAMLKAARERAVAIVAAQSATTIASSSPTEKKRPSKRSRSSSGEKS